MVTGKLARKSGKILSDNLGWGGVGDSNTPSRYILWKSEVKTNCVSQLGIIEISLRFFSELSTVFYCDVVSE